MLPRAGESKSLEAWKMGKVAVLCPKDVLREKTPTGEDSRRSASYRQQASARTGK